LRGLHPKDVALFRQQQGLDTSTAAMDVGAAKRRGARVLERNHFRLNRLAL